MNVSVNRLPLIAGRPKIYNLDYRALEAKYWSAQACLEQEEIILFEQDVLWFQVAVDEACFVQQAQPIQELLRKHTDECRTKTPELVLLDQLVKIDTEQLEH